MATNYLTSAPVTPGKILVWAGAAWIAWRLWLR